MNRYRTGRKLGRTIYRNDELIGIMDTTKDAELVVASLDVLEHGYSVREMRLIGERDAALSRAEQVEIEHLACAPLFSRRQLIAEIERLRAELAAVKAELDEAMSTSNRPGLTVVLFANECPDEPGRLEVDMAFRGGEVHTPKGLAAIRVFTKAIHAALNDACAVLAAEDGEVIQRPDVVLGPKGHA
jgi:hypothetical protein